MLGGRGVGKTSMIAALWNEFSRVCDDPKLQLLPEGQTHIDLNKRLDELKSVAQTSLGAAIKPGAVGWSGILATMEESDYILELYHTGCNANFKIIFKDYPGAWLAEDSKKFGLVVDKISEARILLVAIDVPALMDSEARNDSINHPNYLLTALMRGFRKTQRVDAAGSPPHRLVMFVLMRGEKWLREDTHQEILSRFESRYQTVLRVVRGYANTTCAVICPVQTLGAVSFVRFDENDNHVFERLNNEDYSPVDCDQPLRYSMAFITQALQNYMEGKKDEAHRALSKRKWFIRWKDAALGLFGIKSAQQEELDQWIIRSAELRESVASFASGCKQDLPFFVMQSPELVGLRHSTRSASRGYG